LYCSLQNITSALSNKSCVFLIKHPRIYIVSAFTALFLPITLHGSALETLGGRLLAVSTGALSGLIANTLVSFFSHRRIFNRRLRKIYAALAAQLPEFGRTGPGVLGVVYGMLAQFELETSSALLELRRGKRRHLQHFLLELQKEKDLLLHALHVLTAIHYHAPAGSKLPAEAAELFRTLAQNRHDLAEGKSDPAQSGSFALAEKANNQTLTRDCRELSGLLEDLSQRGAAL
jgi:hypothetical protein